MPENWLDKQFFRLQRRYAMGSGLFASLFLIACVHSLQEKQPLIFLFLGSFVLSRLIGLGWRHLVNQEILKELIERVPEDLHQTERYKKIFLYITYHERGLWVGWSNALGYALILTLIPLLPLILMAGFLVYGLWHYYQLKDASEFIGRMEIHGWEKLGTLAHDPFLKEIDQASLRRASTRRFSYKIDISKKPL